MPKYRVQLSDGRIVTVEADQPPTEDQILGQLGARGAAAPDETDDAPAGGMLPTAGGFVGSLVGTVGGLPGRIAGGAVGGALGKGAELLMDDKDDSVLGSLKAMGVEGAKQGAYEAAGGVAGKALGAMGRGLYRVALRPSKALQQGYPGIIETGVKEGLTVTGRGAAKAAAHTTASRQQADALIAAAEQAGAPPVRPLDVLSEMLPVIQTAKNRATLGVADQTPAIMDRGKRFINANQHGIPLTQAQVLKREAQDMADTAFRAQDKGAVINSTDALADKAMATGLKNEIEKRVPGVMAVNQRTRALKGVSKALEDAGTRGSVLGGLLAPVAVGVGSTAASGDPVSGVMAGLAARGLQSPAALSMAGIGASRLAPAAAMSPQAARLAMLLQELLARQQDQ